MDYDLYASSLHSAKALFRSDPLVCYVMLETVLS